MKIKLKTTRGVDAVVDADDIAGFYPTADPKEVVVIVGSVAVPGILAPDSATNTALTEWADAE